MEVWERGGWGRGWMGVKLGWGGEGGKGGGRCDGVGKGGKGRWMIGM